MNANYDMVWAYFDQGNLQLAFFWLGFCFKARLYIITVISQRLPSIKLSCTQGKVNIKFCALQIIYKESKICLADYLRHHSILHNLFPDTSLQRPLVSFSSYLLFPNYLFRKPIHLGVSSFWTWISSACNNTKSHNSHPSWLLWKQCPQSIYGPRSHCSNYK